jgi:hypothetical protein
MGEIFQDLIIALLISAIRLNCVIQVRFFGSSMKGAWNQHTEGKCLE